MIRPYLGPNKYGCLWKFNANMDSIWQKSLPVPHYDITNESLHTYHIIRATNGDYICGGMYNPNSGNTMIFLTRLDSTGCLVVGTENVAQQQSQQIKVYPNPTSNILNIQYTDFEKKQLSITNVLGRIEKTLALQNENTSINMADFANGIYYLTLYDENKPIYTTKFVVLHE
jgi:hypothetical protein